MSLQIFSTIEEWKKIRNSLDPKVSIGFVPTMGALHKGHLTLVEKAVSENDIVVVSIFVNPTQFNNTQDLTKYPRTLDHDIQFLKETKTDYVFTPEYASLYPDAYRFQITENQFSRELCGQHRPGHFDGVLSVVLKLFNIIAPTRAYFGEKDYQQLQLISDMAKAFFVPVEVISCPTVRETDGLAMSSRNLLLTAEHRARAPLFHQILSDASNPIEARNRLQERGFYVDYVVDMPERRFGAVRLGDVRLIDNVER